LQIELKENYDIGNLTTFRIGGNVDKLYLPQSKEEFLFALKENPEAKVFGNLSNTLISSDGVKETVVSTWKMNHSFIEDTYVYAESGMKGPFLAQKVAGLGLSGLEFLIGFPGTIGGEVYMNASARGQAISDKIVKVELYSHEKGVFTLTKDEMEFGYRSSICQKKPYIVVAAEFKLDEDSKDEIKWRMEENKLFRRMHQPSLVLGNAGSVFKNPDGDSAGRLLDEAGVKGLSIGGAKVWENHANFIVNFNKATSSDVLELMLMMYNKVKEKFGIELKPEIVYLGGNNAREVEICEILGIK